jgi:hypothetical protein
MNAETASDRARSIPNSVKSGDGQDDIEMKENSVGPTGRPRRSAAVNHGMNGWAPKKRKSGNDESDEDDEDDDAGSEPEYGDDEEDEDDEDDLVPDESEDDDGDNFEDEDVDVDDVVMTDTGGRWSLVVKLPIKVTFDKSTGTVKLLKPTQISAEKREQWRSLHHRNIVPSDESEAPELGDPTDRDVKETKKSEAIPVAGKQTTPDPRPTMKVVKEVTPVKSPLTPSSGPSTSLAFRGSPENPPHVPRPIDVGYGE